MKNLTFKQLRRANSLRNSTAFDCADWTPLEWAGAMAGECGEACNLVKKLRKGDKIPRKKIAHELADLITYCDILALKLDIDLGNAVKEKFNIVSRRKKSSIKL